MLRKDRCAAWLWDGAIGPSRPSVRCAAWPSADEIGPSPTRVQALDLPLMRRLHVLLHAGEGVRRLILKLLLPGVNLVGMDLVALRKVRDRRLLPQSSSAIFVFSPASIHRPVCFVIVCSVYQTERPVSNLTPVPKTGFISQHRGLARNHHLNRNAPVGPTSASVRGHDLWCYPSR